MVGDDDNVLCGCGDDNQIVEGGWEDSVEGGSLCRIVCMDQIIWRKFNEEGGYI